MPIVPQLVPVAKAMPAANKKVAIGKSSGDKRSPKTEARKASVCKTSAHIVFIAQAKIRIKTAGQTTAIPLAHAPIACLRLSNR